METAIAACEPNPEPLFKEGKKYAFRHKESGLYLALSNGNDAQDGNATAASLQETGTAFVPLERDGGFVLADEEKYVGISETVAWNVDTTVQTVWDFEETSVKGEYHIYQVGVSKGLGVDNHTAGSGVYTDKAGQIWLVEEVDEKTTGIENMTKNVKNTEIYDLQGRKVNEIGHGIYVVKGRKMMR